MFVPSHIAHKQLDYLSKTTKNKLENQSPFSTKSDVSPIPTLFFQRAVKLKTPHPQPTCFLCPRQAQKTTELRRICRYGSYIYIKIFPDAFPGNLSLHNNKGTSFVAAFLEYIVKLGLLKGIYVVLGAFHSQLKFKSSWRFEHE